MIGLDGVIAKRVDLPYKPGARDAVSKVKHHRTCDCVIVGYRTSGTKIASLLLGLYREDGTLDFVGHTSGIAGPLQAQLQKMLPPLLKEDQHIDQEWGRTPEAIALVAGKRPSVARDSSGDRLRSTFRQDGAGAIQARHALPPLSSGTKNRSSARGSR